MDIWRLATCGYGLHRFSIAEHRADIQLMYRCVVRLSQLACPVQTSWARCNAAPSGSAQRYILVG